MCVVLPSGKRPTLRFLRLASSWPLLSTLPPWQRFAACFGHRIDGAVTFDKCSRLLTRRLNDRCDITGRILDM